MSYIDETFFTKNQYTLLEVFNMENEKELLSYLKEVEKWEKAQKKMFFWERISRLPFKLLDKLTPKIVHEKLGQLLNELGNFVQTGGNYLVSEKSMMKFIRSTTGKEEVASLEDVRELPISDMVKTCDSLQKRRANIATVQGATTGVGGLFTLVVDIPVVLGLALKTLQEIAIVHGYNPKLKEERVFIVKCLQFTFSDVVGKEAILKELAEFHKGSSPNEVMSQIKGWQEVFYTYSDQFGWKKLFQMVPIAGILFGAYANRSMIKDVAEAGTMLYRKRRIYEKLKEID